MTPRFMSLISCLALAACAQHAEVEVKDAWARDSIGGTANAAVFMTIISRTPDRLVGGSTPVARRTDLMTMKGGSGAMAMDYVKAIDVAPGAPVSLNPAGLHVWLEGLDKPLKAGETFPLTLRFEKAGARQVTVKVIKPTDAAPNSAMSM
jgi:periplasmic copper chaperone A